MFKLQKHQLEAVEHVASRCANQRFTLLWHEMGTGKTLTGISIAMSMPTSVKCTIIVPSDVLQPWEYHIKTLKIPAKRARLITFETMKKKVVDLKGHVVIVDEAHNIIVQLLKEKKDWDVIGFTHALKSASKVIFMTGTPVTSSIRGITDLSLLVQIGASQEVLPIQKVQFESKYFHIPNRLRQVMIGKIVPALLANPLLTNAVIGAMGKVTGTVVMQNFKLKLLADYMPATFLLVLNTLLDTISKQVPRQDLWKLDIPKVCVPLKNIILPFRISKDDPNYPDVKEHDQSVVYNRGQIQTLIRLMDNVIDENALKHFFNGDTNKLIEDPKLLGQISSTEFLDQALSVGNMFIDNQPPPKFFGILKLMGRRTVAWSQFIQGMQSFEHFIKTYAPNRKSARIWRGMSNAEITTVLNDFKKGRVDLLFLHPEMYQGISIHGATDMHILEPCIDIMKYAQARARVCRFQSHIHLPPNARHVDVYRWRCSFSRPSILRQIIRQATAGYLGRTNVEKQTSRYVAEYKPHLHYSVPDLAQKNGLNLSPDDTLTFMDKHVDGMTEAIRDYLVKHGSECKQRPIQCCVWQPDKTIMESCTKIKNKRLCNMNIKT